MATNPSIQWRSTESSRQELQCYFDSKKSILHRNINGQHATPFDLAYSIVEIALSYKAKPIPELSFLEPAIGLGVFYSAILRYTEGKSPHIAVGYEKDSELAKNGTILWNSMGLTINHGDFTSSSPPDCAEKQFDLILANPPYVRHQHIKEDKNRLNNLINTRFGWRPSGLMGLYGYFLLITHDWMKENAIGAWIIPREYFDVKYGKAIKKYLLENVELIRIHCFDLVDKKFSDAEVSSSVLFIRKRTPKKGHTVQFTFGPDIKAPLKTIELQLETLRHIDKWSSIEKGVLPPEEKECMKINDLFIVKRGVATGANKYFLMTKDKAKIRGIPAEFLLPILPGSRYLKGDVINCDASGLPLTEPALFLFNCSQSKVELKSSFSQLYDYLSEGEKIGINKRYLTSKRQPWYKQENREPAPLLCGCIATNRGNRKVIRFYRNTSRAIATNTFFLLYAKPSIIALLKDSDKFYDYIFTKLKALNPDKVLSQGRSYGGGLYKIEPKELEELSINIDKKSLNVYLGSSWQQIIGRTKVV
jgi:adenine-specific DNA-methyltransferase